MAEIIPLGRILTISTILSSKLEGLAIITDERLAKYIKYPALAKDEELECIKMNK